MLSKVLVCNKHLLSPLPPICVYLSQMVLLTFFTSLNAVSTCGASTVHVILRRVLTGVVLMHCCSHLQLNVVTDHHVLDLVQ